MEKRLFVIFVFVILQFPVFCHAQEELFPIGMEWEEAFVEEIVYDYDSPILYDTLSFQSYKIAGDTIIGDKAYKTVTRNGESYGACIREADNCVWMKADVYPEEFKLYDFNWDGKESVTIQFLRWNDYRQTSIRLVEEVLDMAWRSSLTTDGGMVESLSKGFCYIIIRGLGRVSDIHRNSCLLGYSRLFEDLPHMIYSRVLWVKRNGTIVFTYPVDETEGIMPQDKGHRQTSTAFYDLQGRRVSPPTSHLSPLKKGIYIENGRKRVVSR